MLIYSMKVTKNGNTKANIAIDNLRICVVSHWHSNHGKQPRRSYDKDPYKGSMYVSINNQRPSKWRGTHRDALRMSHQWRCYRGKIRSGLDWTPDARTT